MEKAGLNYEPVRIWFVNCAEFQIRYSNITINYYNKSHLQLSWFLKENTHITHICYLEGIFQAWLGEYKLWLSYDCRTWQSLWQHYNLKHPKNSDIFWYFRIQHGLFSTYGIGSKNPYSQLQVMLQGGYNPFPHPEHSENWAKKTAYGCRRTHSEDIFKRPCISYIMPYSIYIYIF